MSDARNFHEEYDGYEIPDHIRVVQVAGWGIPTTKAVNYKTNHGLQSYETVPTREGDATVVYPSAISSDEEETYFFNLDLHRDPNNKVFQHRDILNAVPVQVLFKSVLKKENIEETNVISSLKPQVVNLNDQLIVTSNSPVILGAYDEAGNFTGIDPNQNLSADVLSISEEIPGSTFLYTSEGQKIFLLKEGKYNVVYKGIGDGPTTLEIDSFIADTVVPIISYEDIPTTSNTIVSFTLESSTPENNSISVDLNGDGTLDFILPYTFSGFLQPINAGQDRSVFKAGSTVPVKFQLKNEDGLPIQAKTIPIWLNSQKGSKMNDVIDESVYSVAATSGNAFKWDVTGQQYIYNWSTKELAAGYWYKISAKLDDGNTYSVTVGLR